MKRSSGRSARRALRGGDFELRPFFETADFEMSKATRDGFENQAAQLAQKP